MSPLQVADANPSAPVPPYNIPAPSDSPAEVSLDAAPSNHPVDHDNNPVPPVVSENSITPVEPEPEQEQEQIGMMPSAPVARVSPNMTGAVNTETDPAVESEQPGDLIDLNTGTFEQLNSLRGGGPIGRAIIKGRPYVSTEDLVTKKVLRRSVYEQIKDQVTVQ